MDTGTRRDRLITAGGWLREQRNSRHLTQQQLAQMVGVSNASLSAYERGVSTPDDMTIEAIARVVQQPVSDVRERWGLYNNGPATTPPPPASVLEAILADPDLRDDFKQHISAQYKILRDATLATRAPSESTAEMLGRKLEQQERAESGLSQDRPTPNY